MHTSSRQARALVAVLLILAVAACCVGTLGSDAQTPLTGAHGRLVSVLGPTLGPIGASVAAAGRNSAPASTAAQDGARCPSESKSGLLLSVRNQAPGLGSETHFTPPLRI